VSPRLRTRLATAVTATLATAIAVPILIVAAPANAATTWPGSLVTVTPTRVLDTRINVGASTPPAQGTTVLRIGATSGIPLANTSAVVLNLTATQPESAGYLTAFAPGTARPITSNLNFVAGASAQNSVSNLVVAPIDSLGQTAIYNGSGGRVDLVGDLVGYYLKPTDQIVAGAFTPLTPTRLLDTRIHLGGSQLDGEAEMSLVVSGRGGVPSTHVSAVLLSVTVTAPEADGYLTVFPGTSGVPDSSSLNFVAGATAQNSVANTVVAQLGSNGQIDLFNGSLGRTHVVVDVLGWYGPASGAGNGLLTPMAPQRLLDTRTGATPQKLPPGGTVTTTAKTPTTPGNASGAVLNVTVTNPTAAGYITVYAAGTSAPPTSSVNFRAGQTVANLVKVPIDSNGQLTVRMSETASADVVVDLYGTF